MIGFVTGPLIIINFIKPIIVVKISYRIVELGNIMIFMVYRDM